ncbi:MAG: rRNA pseudouridine synthase [Butyrivibrio sp.]|nr:rRNA pseudouridine synthase [Butyrivibrio sp.]
MRLNKYISSCGICSRREADKLIASGRITVNGLFPMAGDDVSETDVVCLDGKSIRPVEKLTYLAYYKPVGTVCTKDDPHAKRTIYDDIGSSGSLSYAGRLDKDSEGLLIITDDGKLIDAIMRGRNAHEKEYVVTIDKKIDKSFLSHMANGVYLKDLDRTTRPCKIWATSDNSFHIILTQGLNRQIRRMCSELGATVSKLKRIRVMTISLDDLDLKPGEFVSLSDEVVKKLYQETGI